MQAVVVEKANARGQQDPIRAHPGSFLAVNRTVW
jgi:hypothetical protein